MSDELNDSLEAMKQARRQEGLDAYRKISRAFNTMTDEDVIDGFIQGFLRDHRTLQQGFVRAVYQLLTEFGNRSKENPAAWTDARNEATSKFAQAVVEKIPGVFFPYV